MASQAPPVKYPGGRKALWGVAAFFAGYALVYLWVGLNPDWIMSDVVLSGDYTGDITLAESLESTMLAGERPGSEIEYTGEVSTWKAVGVFFLGTHLVGARVPLASGEGIQFAPVTDAGGIHLLLLAVPAVMLLLAGFLATRGISDPYDFRFDLGNTTTRRYAWNGALPVVMGYLPFAVLGPLFFQGTMTPNMLTGWLLAALAYPLVFGALGGVLGSRFADRYETKEATAFREARRTD